ncbi:MAG: beta-carotene ketolase [Leptolyngbyaceae cyanobacterium CSU_1_4]|nr:beta-carotene ketolase [Leptolyngbyaceae cyanobacterium CSU_1_4]
MLIKDLIRVKIMPTANQHKNTVWGVMIAFLVISLWAMSLGGLLMVEVRETSLVWIILGILLRTFLSTGLFITAHDAMHGSVFPNNLKLNHAVGTLALLLYALLPYKMLLKKHHLHHRYPTGERDPDFYEGEDQNFFVWYFHFMRGYWSWGRFFGLLAIALLLSGGLQVSFLNLVLFWFLPLGFSSFQLFFFGTFLPHRRPIGGYEAPYYSQSFPLPIVLSFLSCYHFGYHQEHHQYPQVPWWQLPKVYRLATPAD